MTKHRQWLHGIEHMTTSGGYIYWKGREVEHYNHPFDEESKPKLQNLAERCRHLERLGIPVNTSTAVWRYSWFENLQSEDRYLPFLRDLEGIYERSSSDDELLIRFTCGFAFRSVDGKWLYDLSFESLCRRIGIDHDAANNEYHSLKAAGFSTAKAGQAEYNGLCYATTEGLLGYLAARHVSPEVVEVAKALRDSEKKRLILEGRRCLAQAGVDLDAVVRVAEVAGVIREDTIVAFGTGKEDEIDELALDWPDFAVSFHEICEALGFAGSAIQALRESVMESTNHG